MALNEGVLVDLSNNQSSNSNLVSNNSQHSDPQHIAECPVDFDLTWKILHGIPVPHVLESESIVSSEPTDSTTQNVEDSKCGTTSSNTGAAQVDVLDASTSRPNDAPQVAYGYDTDWDERTRPTETGFMRFLIFLAEGCGYVFSFYDLVDSSRFSRFLFH